MEKILNNLNQEFRDWLVGLLEEDPLPPEITTLYFFYGKINNGNYIRFCATEIDNGEYSDFTYNPLEAQHFYSANFIKYFETKKLDDIKNFIKSNLLSFKKVYALNDLFTKKIVVKEYNFII